MAEPLPIDQILLLKSSSLSRELGGALWAAFKEVEAFYNLDRQRAEFRRIYLAEAIPDALQAGGLTAIPGLGRVFRLFFGPSEEEHRQAMAKERFLGEAPPSLWQQAQGRFSRTYRAAKIAELVRDLVGTDGEATKQLVVTDQELTPPPDWRYLIWEDEVVSVVPVDPRYWRMRESNRVSLIKHRVRTACLSIVGELLGLEPCNNENCFLYRTVDSVLNLDRMVQLGPEHGLKALTGRGFAVLTDDPDAVAPVEPQPEPILEIG